MTATPVGIGVDVGGTKIVLGVVHDDHSCSRLTRIETARRDPAWVVAAVTGYARELEWSLPVGVGAAGAADPEGAVHFGSFIAWNGFPLRAVLEAELGVPVFVQNDVTVAAWGEYLLDPRRRSVAVIAAGTGVGGGAVSDGVLLTGAGAAMEIGHLPVSLGESLCACGRRGCLESIASGTSVARRYAERTPDRAATRPLSSTDVVAAARNGDEVARAILAEAGAAIGEAAALIASVIDPERVVLSGGLIRGGGPEILAAARAAFARQVRVPNDRGVPIIELSTAEQDPIVIGAGMLAAARNAERAG